MKRNNIFMWAYITFILLCSIIRVFADFSLWSPIVLAITISGVFFAIEDLFSSLANSLKGSIDIADNFIVHVRENINKDLKFCEKVENITELYNGTEHDLSDVKKSFAPLFLKVHEMDDELSKFETRNINNKKKRKKICRIANIFAYIGFLCLLFILVIASFVNIPTIIQDVVTVVPFAIILITHQINSNTTERLKKESLDSQDALNKHLAATNKLLESEEKFNYLINLIEKAEEDSEVMNYAD